MKTKTIISVLFIAFQMNALSQSLNLPIDNYLYLNGPSDGNWKIGMESPSNPYSDSYNITICGAGYTSTGPNANRRFRIVNYLHTELFNVNLYTGNIGIGTTSPTSKLSLFNNGTCGIHIDNNTFDWDIEAYNSGVFGGFFIKQRGCAIATFYRDGGVRFSTGTLQVATRNLTPGYGDNVHVIFEVNDNGNMFLEGKLTAKEIEVKANVWADYVF